MTQDHLENALHKVWGYYLCQSDHDSILIANFIEELLEALREETL